GHERREDEGEPDDEALVPSLQPRARMFVCSRPSLRTPPNGAPPRIASRAAPFEITHGLLARRLHQPCSPPSSQMIRMIGIGIPISHNSKPRPMVSSWKRVSEGKREPVHKVPCSRS